MNGRLQLKDKLKVYSWMLFDWACQPIHTLIATFIFGPYFVQAVVDNPVEGQALIGMAVTVSGIAVAIFSPILGAVADQTQKRKPWILMFSVFFVISTFFHIFFFLITLFLPRCEFPNSHMSINTLLLRTFDN